MNKTITIIGGVIIITVVIWLFIFPAWQKYSARKKCERNGGTFELSESGSGWSCSSLTPITYN